MEGLNTNDLLCCRFCSVSRLILNAWKILAFCGRILGQLCINFGKPDGCVIDKCCLRYYYRGSSGHFDFLDLVQQQRIAIEHAQFKCIRLCQYGANGVRRRRRRLRFAVWLQAHAQFNFYITFLCIVIHNITLLSAVA